MAVQKRVGGYCSDSENYRCDVISFYLQNARHSLKRILFCATRQVERLSIGSLNAIVKHKHGLF